MDEHLLARAFPGFDGRLSVIEMELKAFLLSRTVLHGLAGPRVVGKRREEDGGLDSELIHQQMQYFLFGRRLAVLYVILRP